MFTDLSKVYHKSVTGISRDSHKIDRHIPLVSDCLDRVSHWGFIGLFWYWHSFYHTR